MKLDIPKEIFEIAAKLTAAGYSSYLVGGSVRDLLLKRIPKDWDIATNAKPDEIQKLFSRVEGETSASSVAAGTVYENKFGTVGVKTGSDNPALAVVEVTTFREEESYSDFRHPDNVKFTDTLEKDLARRDFTINSLALSIAAGVCPEQFGSTHYKLAEGACPELAEGMASQLIDLYGGQKDLKNKIIRAVGDADKRFTEDALRLIRAVRLASELGFKIEEKTAAAIKRNSALLGKIAAERIRDELTKLIMSDGGGPKDGIEQLEELGLLSYILPELREGIGVTQNKHHIYTVWEHNLRALDYSARHGASLEVRLASLLHDVGKPRVKNGEGPNSTFYGHEIVGAKMTRTMLMRLHFPNKVVDHVAHLVRHHLFYYNVGEVTAAGVRRFLNRVGPENIDDLIKVRESDRVGSGVPKAAPYKLRHLRFMLEKVKTDPISPKMLAINGNDVMEFLGIQPGPRVGYILSILLEDVLDDPRRNLRESLEERARELNKLPDGELAGLAKKAREKKDESQQGIEEEMKKKYYV
jgi:tRNA nucleotidyltransferase (CCA-adding enzyme)